MSKAQQIQTAAEQLDAAKNVQRVIGGRAADQAVKDATTTLQQVAGRRK
ncbi:hypothetical protein ACFW0V_31000 [Micromonospora parva]